MRIDILSIFPNMFESPFAESIIKRAQNAGKLEVLLHDIRSYTEDKHHTVDDTPYGGGAGMVMKPEPIVKAVEGIPSVGSCMRVFLSPQGTPFSQELAHELAGYEQIVLICGRYEGVDERARSLISDKEISIGDYVLSGGEIPAMVVVDAVARLLPGVLGNSESIVQESFEDGTLEYPQYTHPYEFRGMKVPDVLLSGNHAEIEKWRRKMSEERTSSRRPDLLKK